jgi:hypothetical protein
MKSTPKRLFTERLRLCWRDADRFLVKTRRMRWKSTGKRISRAAAMSFLIRSTRFNASAR